MKDLFYTRRSCRKYLNESIKKEQLDEILETLLRSPSSRGFRPWQIIVVTESEIIKSLSKAKAHGSSFLTLAPAALVIVGDPGKSDVWVEDTSILCTTCLYKAEGMGIGACWIQIRNRLDVSGTSSDSVVKKILSIPDELQVEAIIALGYPDKESKPYNKEDLPYHTVHYQKYS